MFFPSLRAPLVVFGAYAAGVLAVPTASATTHDLSAAYSPTELGTGGSSVKPPKLLTHVDTVGTPKDFYANLKDITSIKLPRDLAAGYEPHDPKFRSCSPRDKDQVLRALKTVKRNAAMVVRYLEISETKSLYQTWFGQLNEARLNRVKDIFSTVSRGVFVDYVYVCNGNSPFSAVLVDNWANPLQLRFCQLFWNDWEYPDIQARQIIGAAIHLQQYGGLGIHSLNREAAAGLPPGLAVQNVGSYLEFLTDVVARSRPR